jgi:hypothetical protein
MVLRAARPAASPVEAAFGLVVTEERDRPAAPASPRVHADAPGMGGAQVVVEPLLRRAGSALLRGHLAPLSPNRRHDPAASGTDRPNGRTVPHPALAERGSQGSRRLAFSERVAVEPGASLPSLDSAWSSVRGQFVAVVCVGCVVGGGGGGVTGEARAGVVAVRAVAGGRAHAAAQGRSASGWLTGSVGRCQPGASASTRSKARLSWSRHGQVAERWSVRRRLERVSRPARWRRR